MGDAAEAALPQRHNARRRMREHQQAEVSCEPGSSGRIVSEVSRPCRTVDDTQTDTTNAVVPAKSKGTGDGDIDASSLGVQHVDRTEMKPERLTGDYDYGPLAEYRCAAVGNFKFECG